ncbi:hypothetical protein VM1G_11540 [Cytospora mali]|uniref:Uncharacterized protein n=1 Tax=Cytospora mali TaxID=578113 RepID=A0A194VYB0_CYTMA|nr:hypothetical protein VM1G_11540 [Valsa mali]
MEEGVEGASLEARTFTEPAQPHAHRDDVLEEVLDYAYENDLIRDYRLDSFSLTHLFGKLIQSTIPTTTEDGLTNFSHLAALELPNPTPCGEKPSISDSALRLICGARRELSDEEVKALEQDVCNDNMTRGLKLELPILQTDNDRDLGEFRRELLARQEIQKRDHRIPFEPVDVAAGEGLELPAEAQLEVKAFLNKLEGEKLGITSESTRYLAGNLRAGITEEAHMSFVLEEIRDIKSDKNSAPEKLELPISPILRQDYLVPDACLIPIPSDPSSSILSDDLKAAETCLFEDVDKWDEHTSPILEEFLKDSSPLMDEEPGRERLNDHKIEMPLLPCLSPAKQTLSRPDVFNKLVVEELNIDKELDTAVVEEVTNDNLEDQLEVMADRAIKSIEQEQLQAADAIARVLVPVMDFSISEPKWTRFRNSAAAILRLIQAGHEDIFKLPKWPRDMLTESKLIWQPVGPGANPLSITEKIESSEAVIKSFLGDEDEKDLPDSSDFIAKRDRLAVLQEDDEGEGIEPLLTKSRPRNDLVETAKRRGVDIVGNTLKKQRLAGKEPFTNQANAVNATPAALTGNKPDIDRRERQTLLLGKSSRAPARFLGGFVELHAPKKLMASKYFPLKEAKDEVPTLPSPPESSDRDHRNRSKDPQVEPSVIIPSKSVSRAPCPLINMPPAPPTVFISLSIARYLIGALGRLIPSINMIERDYCAYNTSIWSPGSVCRAEVVPPLAYDADITVSPTTGLIITSMILIRQKPRPGVSKSGFQERIEKVSLRYERVVVLVGGEGGSDDTLREITTSDSTVLAELQGFVSGLECKVVVYYVGGGDDTMSRWVSSMICRYAQMDHPQIQKGLLEAETLWELFLRRAGFNVYAAQAVAGLLKVPNSEEKYVASSRHGLAAFVTMTRAERKQRFGQLVGPRVLERVSQIVDEIWNKG